MVFYFTHRYGVKELHRGLSERKIGVVSEMKYDYLDTKVHEINEASCSLHAAISYNIICTYE